jgi:hypothetical protein
MSLPRDSAGRTRKASRPEICHVEGSGKGTQESGNKP